MHLIQWILYVPLHWCYDLGYWIRDTVFTPFSIGMTAKTVTEEELGVYGVLGFVIYKIMLLPIDAHPRFRPDWLRWDWRRALQLFGLAIGVSYVISIVYIGVISPTLQLHVGLGALIAASVVAWGALVYHYVRERIDKNREAKEAEKEAAEENA